MPNVKIDILDTNELDDVLENGETLLWSGTPEYGTRLHQIIGEERIWFWGLLLASGVIWLTFPFAKERTTNEPIFVILTYSFCALLFAVRPHMAAAMRSEILSNLVYLLTDRRCIVCRSGRNWRLGLKLYVVSCYHSDTFPYEIFSTRPFELIRVGTLLSDDVVQPFGFGVSHPGQPPLWNRITSPGVFEQITAPRKILGIIQANISR